ncbi:387_t:CDS:2 [Gigaspora margarita]|uniref:387_t:CDS:1 n=1 Tax=Gigaspora margarita TaxID=4874 RepID=A0ABM8VWY6_GIGMA|nr:387_t:CDS:2 [Gigaspora margarita]
MEHYIYQKSKKIYILDWGKIIKSCNKLEDYIGKLVAEGKKILFLATKKPTQDIVKEQALRGFLTNFGEIEKKLYELKKLTAFMQKDSFQNLAKKEQVKIQKRRDKLYSIYEGVATCNQRPDALFIIGLEQEKTALKEAKKCGIPVIAVCNTNCNPKLVDYVLPGNDEEKMAVNFFASLVANAIKKVKEKSESERVERAKQPGQLTGQGYIENTLQEIFSFSIRVFASGRTDKGVHAREQKFTFLLPFFLTNKKLFSILKKRLEEYFLVKNVERVNSNFHPLYNVVSKEYRYFINVGKPNIWQKKYC